MGWAEEGSPLPALPFLPQAPHLRPGLTFLLQVWLFAGGFPRSAGAAGGDCTGRVGTLTCPKLQTAPSCAHTSLFPILPAPGAPPSPRTRAARGRGEGRSAPGAAGTPGLRAGGGREPAQAPGNHVAAAPAEPFPAPRGVLRCWQMAEPNLLRCAPKKES